MDNLERRTTFATIQQEGESNRETVERGFDLVDRLRDPNFLCRRTLTCRNYRIPREEIMKIAESRGWKPVEVKNNESESRIENAADGSIRIR